MGNYFYNKPTVQNFTGVKESSVKDASSLKESSLKVYATVKVSAPKTYRTILINQAYCYKCNFLVKDGSTCTCGNVTVFGGNKELGRKVKDDTFYSDYSLFEYKPVESTKTYRTILINQAYCYKCNSLVKDMSTCTCGNVTVFGGNKELGRTVKDDKFYSDYSLVEYKP